MSKSRRIGAMVAMATAAVGVAAGTSATPAVATPLGGPQPVSSWLRAVKAHSDSWVNIYWRTTGPSCDVKVKVAGRGVAVSYPGHRRFASLSRGTMLRPSRPDYTPISVDPDFGRPGVAILKTSIAYNDCTRHARTQYRNFTLTLPVQRNHNWPGHGFPGQPGGPVKPGNGGNTGPGNSHPQPADSPTPVWSPAPNPVVTTSPAATVSPSAAVSPAPAMSVSPAPAPAMSVSPSAAVSPAATMSPSAVASPATAATTPAPAVSPSPSRSNAGHGPVH